MDLKAILAEHNISETPNRLIVLGFLAEADAPMTMQEITDEIGSIDKSNVFRTLNTFREHGLVHAIEACDEGVLYELCCSHNDENDEDVHPHFHCTKCHKVICLKGVSIPKIDYPDGFMVEEESFVVSGICPDCAHRE